MIGTSAPRVARCALLMALLGTLAASSSRAIPAHAAVPPLRLAAHGQAAAGLIVAVALHGDIYAMRVDGSGRTRLTTGGQASSPQLSPDGRTIAYFVADRKQTAPGTPSGEVYVLPLDAAIGATARPLDGTHTAQREARLLPRHRPGAREYPCPRDRDDPAAAAWHQLHGGCAWSPDAGHLAVSLARPGMQAVPQTLLVAVGVPGSAHWQQITIRSSAGALGLRNGNIPVPAPSNDPVWTPDGRGFLLSTQLVGEGPPSITGIWRVGTRGGLAHLAIGTASGVRRGIPEMGGPFAQATRFLLSPDRTLLATDPPRGLWVSQRRREPRAFPARDRAAHLRPRAVRLVAR